MGVDVSKLIITEVAQITAFNNAGDLEFIMDEVQNGTISNTQEKFDVQGRNGRKLLPLQQQTACLSAVLWLRRRVRKLSRAHSMCALPM